MSKLALLFILIFTSMFVAIFIIGPSVGVFLYELVYFLNPHYRWWGGSIPNVSYSFIVTLAMLVMFIVQHKKHQHNILARAPEVKWLALLLLMYCAVTIVAVQKELHTKFLIELIKLYAVTYIFYRVLDTRNKLLVALFIYVVGCAYIGYEAMSVGRNSAGRVEGIGTVDAPEANGTAAMLVPAIPLLIYFVWRGNWKLKLATLIFGALIANGLILINSRGAFLGGIAAAGFFMWVMAFSKYKLPWQRMMVMFVLIGSTLGVIRFTDDVFWERMGSIQNSSSKESEGSGGRRINYWLATFDMVGDYPFGTGIWGYQTLSRFYLSEELMSDRKEQQTKAVHSMWFQGFSEVGWLGIGLFFTFLAHLTLRVRKTKKYLAEKGDIENFYLVLAIQSGLLGFLIAGSFIDAFRAVVLYWFFAYSMVANSLFYLSSEELTDKN